MNAGKLFGSTSTVGINFEKYNDIKVERSGPGTEDTAEMVSFDDLAKSDFNVPAFLSANISA